MMHPDTRRQATRLFTAFEYGEQRAHNCARQQLRWIDDPRAQRFLKAQVRQQATHAQRIQTLAAGYLQQVHRIIVEMSDVFVSLDEDPGENCTDPPGNLPDWIRGPRS